MPVVTVPFPVFSLYVQCIKVCMTAQSYCPQASGTSQQQSHHSQCCRTVSAYGLLCRTVQGELWPCCAHTQTPWSVTHSVSSFHINAPRRDKIHLLQCVCPRWALTLTASLKETSLMELRGGYSLPSARSSSVTRRARACLTANKQQMLTKSTTTWKGCI